MRSVTIGIIGPVFAGEIYVLLDPVVSGQVALREESGAKRAAALLPLIAHKLGIVTGRNTTIENGNSYSVSGSAVRNATTNLRRSIFRQNLAGAGRHFDVAGIIRRVGNRIVDHGRKGAHLLIGRNP